MSNNEIKWDFSAPMIMTSSCVTQPPLPSTIHFHHTIDNDKTEVMRITREGVWVNPDMAADETAKAVLDALDSYIKVLVQNAVEAEREACAELCEEMEDRDNPYERNVAVLDCAAAIRERNSHG